MNWVKNKIVGWWKHSRIIFINVAYAILLVGQELVFNLAGFDWDAMFRHEIAMFIGMGVSVASILLRMYPRKPEDEDEEDDDTSRDT